MIPLKFNRINLDKRYEIVDEYCTSYYQQFGYRKKLDEWVKNNLPRKLFAEEEKKSKFNEYFLNKPFLTVMEAEYKTIEKIVEYWDKEGLKNNFGYSDYLKRTLYNKIGKKEFAKIIDESVCPYCNRNFIFNTANSNNCQLDHFFSKSEYPLLAVSFYNLVPVCPSCNFNKNEKKMSYSVHNPDYNADELLTFSYCIAESMSENIERRFKPIIKSGSLFKDNAEVLELEQLYYSNRDVIEDLYDMSIKYPKGFVASMEKEYGIDHATAARWAVGAYVNVNDYGKRPLSKMITDISKEMNIL